MCIRDRYNPQAGGGSPGSAKPVANGQPSPSTAPSATSYHSSYYSTAGPVSYNYSSGRLARPRSSFDTFNQHNGAEMYDNKQSALEAPYRTGTKTTTMGASATSPVAASATSNSTNGLINNSNNSSSIPPSLTNSRGLYWRNGRGGKYGAASRYNGFKKHEYGSEDAYELPKSRKSFESHSLGSSLINSCLLYTSRCV